MQTVRSEFSRAATAGRDGAQMTEWVRAKRIVSQTGRQWVDIETREAGHSRFVETTVIFVDNEDFPTLTHFSGIYVNA